MFFLYLKKTFQNGINYISYIVKKKKQNNTMHAKWNITIIKYLNLYHCLNLKKMYII